jgi:hypothetical protein
MALVGMHSHGIDAGEPLQHVQSGHSSSTWLLEPIGGALGVGGRGVSCLGIWPPRCGAGLGEFQVIVSVNGSCREQRDVIVRRVVGLRFVVAGRLVAARHSSPGAEQAPPGGQEVFVIVSVVARPAPFRPLPGW